MEYIEREESDGEYDEVPATADNVSAAKQTAALRRLRSRVLLWSLQFGRKKKKFRGKSSNSTPSSKSEKKEVEKPKEEEPDDEDDDEEEGDLSKYKLDVSFQWRFCSFMCN